MPIYEYTCTDCKQSFEAIRKMSEAPLTECLVCGKVGTVVKQFSQTASPSFKGSGWHTTDYRGAKKPK